MKLRILIPLMVIILCSCTPKEGVETVEQVLSNRLGPNGETPASLIELEEALAHLGPRDFKDQEFDIMLSMHDVNNDWSLAILNGLEDCLDEFGLSLALVTDGAFNMDKQQADLRNILQRRPHVLLSLPLDTEILAPEYQLFADQDIPMVFIDAVPQGLKAGEDYIGWVVGDAYHMGYLGAQVLAESLDQGGEVALLHWGNSMFTVDERSLGARDYLANQDRVILAEELYFQEFFEIEELTRDLITNHPQIAGLWAVWDTPGFEAMEILKQSAPHVRVSSCDLSRELAEEIRVGSMVVGSGVDHPYDQGWAVGLLTLVALKGLDLESSFYVVYAEKAHEDNWEEVWHRMYNNSW